MSSSMRTGSTSGPASLLLNNREIFDQCLIDGHIIVEDLKEDGVPQNYRLPSFLTNDYKDKSENAFVQDFSTHCQTMVKTSFSLDVLKVC